MKYANINSVVSVVLSIIAFSVAIESSRKYSTLSLKQEELSKTLEFYFTEEKSKSSVLSEGKDSDSVVVDAVENEEAYYKRLLEEKQNTQSNTPQSNFKKESVVEKSNEIDKPKNNKMELKNPNKVKTAPTLPLQKKEVSSNTTASKTHKVSFGVFKNSKNALGICSQKLKKYKLTGLKCVSSEFKGNKSLNNVYMDGFKSLDDASKVCSKLKSEKISCQVN